MLPQAHAGLRCSWVELFRRPGERVHAFRRGPFILPPSSSDPSRRSDLAPRLLWLASCTFSVQEVSHVSFRYGSAAARRCAYPKTARPRRVAAVRPRCRRRRESRAGAHDQRVGLLPPARGAGMGSRGVGRQRGHGGRPARPRGHRNRPGACPALAGGSARGQAAQDPPPAARLRAARADGRTRRDRGRRRQGGSGRRQDRQAPARRRGCLSPRARPGRGPGSPASRRRLRLRGGCALLRRRARAGARAADRRTGRRGSFRRLRPQAHHGRGTTAAAARSFAEVHALLAAADLPAGRGDGAAQELDPRTPPPAATPALPLYVQTPGARITKKDYTLASRSRARRTAPSPSTRCRTW